MANSGPLGQQRGIAFVILISLITFGIYTLYWDYKTYEEMKQHTGDGLGGFTASTIDIGGGTGPFGLGVGDFDHDGNLDAIVANYQDDSVSVLLGDRSGGFSMAPGSPITGGPAQSVTVGDFNGDGKADFASGRNDEQDEIGVPQVGTVSIFLGTGTGTFNQAPG